MEMSMKVLVGIVLVVLTFLIALGIMGVLTGNTNTQLGNFFGFLGEIEPATIGG